MERTDSSRTIPQAPDLVQTNYAALLLHDLSFLQNTRQFLRELSMISSRVGDVLSGDRRREKAERLQRRCSERSGFGCFR